MMPRHIDYEPGMLRLLDQTKLPDAVEFVELRDWQSVARAIEVMQVRGAPAIGIAGAYGMALAAHAYAARSDLQMRMMQAGAGLTKTRSTAVNLSWAVHRMLDAMRTLLPARGAASDIAGALDREARAIHEEDVAACRRIGDAGAVLIPSGASVLTHCNTGSLATGGYGTALGIVRSAWRDGKLKRALVGETRPVLQGARLTAWELAQDAIPHTLIADSAAAHFMKRGEVQAVVVGADRIARNGDVVNKIGTYALAVLAREHGIAFLVAAPSSTFDLGAESGDTIPIEERDAREVTEIRGVRLAPGGTEAANPAFDVTPAEYVTAIVTER